MKHQTNHQPGLEQKPRLIEVADGGTIYYHEHFLARDEADALFETLKKDVPWRQEKTVFGHLTPRLTAYYGDPGIVYQYSGITHQPLEWLAELSDIRRRIEDEAGASFNSLLLNYYRDGSDSMGYHADNEPELGSNPIIPSLSLGAVRRFILKHNTTGEKLTYALAHGSLLIMGGTLQHHWKHALPKTKEKAGERINLTFRNILLNAKNT